jgi:TatD DNase family protein
MDVLCVTTTPSAWHGTAHLAGNSPYIRTGLGLHPQLAHLRKTELNLFDALLDSTPFVGEVGLDGSSGFRPHWRDQALVFDHILAQCVSVGGKILSVHSRGASTEVLDRIEHFHAAGTFILHWFSGSLRDLARAIKMGCWFSVGPAMLLGAKGRKLVAEMPRERVLTESDGPFAQVNGQCVKPWQLQPAICELGLVWSITESDVDRQIQSNLDTLLDGMQ